MSVMSNSVSTFVWYSYGTSLIKLEEKLIIKDHCF